MHDRHMTQEEHEFYRRIRNVDISKSTAAAKSVMSKKAAQQFWQDNDSRSANVARLDPLHNAYRSVIERSADMANVRHAASQARRKPRRLSPAKLFVPVAPKTARLKLGSVHLVDVPPFQALTWQDIAVYNGTTESNPPQPSADGQTGDMSFSIDGGGWDIDNNSSVSCWCAIGQTYVMPPGVEKPETGGAFLRFSASPSFNWSALWGSGTWRLASGNIWIGQVVNRFDQNWTWIDTPVSYQQSLFSWNDYNFADSGEQSNSNTSFGLSTSVFVQPNFFYNCWVWIGATAYGDWVDTGWSYSTASMNANVSTLTLDTF